MPLPVPFRIRIGRTSASLSANGHGSGSPTLSLDERLFALGTRTLADLIAPAGAEVRRDHLQLDAHYVRILAVTGYPRTVAAGWLAPLIDELDLPLELSLHVRPLSSADMVHALGVQIAKLESSRRVDMLAQRIGDPERDIGLEDAERLRTALQRGDEGSGPGGTPGVLDMYERAVLDQALMQTYAAAGITSDPATHNHPAPVIAHLQAALNQMEGDVGSLLATRLRRHIPGEGSLGAGVFSGRTNVALDQPFTVFYIRELPKELWPLAIHLISGHVWNTARRVRRQRLLVVDEAAMLLAHPSGGAFLADVARRARKHYLGLITIWQKVGDLTASEHGETILTNSEMKLLLKQSEEIIDVADERFRLTPGERRFLLGALKGEGLLLARGGRWPLRIEASPAEHRLATTNPRDLVELAAQSRQDTLPLTIEPQRANGNTRAVARP